MNKNFIRFIASIACSGILISGISAITAEENSQTENTQLEITLEETETKSADTSIFTYEESGDSITITDVKDVTGRVDIPEEINGKPVTKISDGTFGGSSNITEVFIPDTVTEIGETCFAYSTGIKKVKLSKSITKISSGMFAHCDTLIGITIPYGVTVVEDSAFAYCPLLSSISVPTTVTNIADNAFTGSDSVYFYCKLSDEPYGVTYATEKGISYSNLINVYLNGTEVDFDQAPITDNKRFRTLVPLRSVLEEMGAKIRWYDDMNYAGLTIGDYRILIKPEEEFMRVNNNTVFLSSPAIEYNNRILLPIRDVVEAVGGKVVWKENSTSVFITYNK